eukprot:EC723095.1.p2 GENE.EC723095.1~~EC723095.1.p2  ORF type:complete len:50 (-),score=2.30 EC723095.1:172-321(-)
MSIPSVTPVLAHKQELTCLGYTLTYRPDTFAELPTICAYSANNIDVRTS